MDADIIQMKTLRSTTSTHDDWLHRGPYLHDNAFHTYAEYIDRVRLPRHAPAEEQIFRFEPHYALARSYGQRLRTPARFPVLEALRFSYEGRQYEADVPRSPELDAAAVFFSSDSTDCEFVYDCDGNVAPTSWLADQMAGWPRINCSLITLKHKLVGTTKNHPF
mgnify:CR=1 FL=1